MGASAASPFEIALPACWSAELKVERNRARQLLDPAGRGTVLVEEGRPYFLRDNGQRVSVVAGPAAVSSRERALKAPRAALKDPAALAAAELRWIGSRQVSAPEDVR